MQKLVFSFINAFILKFIVGRVTSRLNFFTKIIWQVLSEFDIFAVVGANKPLQLIDSWVSVKENGEILVRFESVNGSPLVSGICIRRAPRMAAGILFMFMLLDWFSNSP